MTDRNTRRTTIGRISAAALGPFAWESRVARVSGVLVVMVLLLTTQVGAIIWPVIGLAARARHSVTVACAAGALAYSAASVLVVPLIARGFGREHLPCMGDRNLQPRSWFYCAANRHYVTHRMALVAAELADTVAARHPGSRVLYLDAGFPFPGMPLLPHLSHGDGRKLDLAFQYMDAEGGPMRVGGSPIGYFGYAFRPPDIQPACEPRWWDLRWDLNGLQAWLGRDALDIARTSTQLNAALEHPRVAKVLLEPHVQHQLGAASPILRFQGCHAARHDDHMHIELR